MKKLDNSFKPQAHKQAIGVLNTVIIARYSREDVSGLATDLSTKADHVIINLMRTAQN